MNSISKISKNIYMDKLEDIVNIIIHIIQQLKTKPVDVKSNTFIGSNHHQNVILEFLSFNILFWPLPWQSIDAQGHQRYYGYILQHFFFSSYLVFENLAGKLRLSLDEESSVKICISGSLLFCLPSTRFPPLYFSFLFTDSAPQHRVTKYLFTR